MAGATNDSRDPSDPSGDAAHPPAPCKPVIVGLGEILWDMLPGGRQLGGAPANFAYHSAALGAAGVVVSRVGDDALGREILTRLDALGLGHRFVSVDPLHPTGTVNVRLEARGVPAYVIHTDVAWDFLPGPADDTALLELAGRADAVCFGTLGQRSAVSHEAIRAFLHDARPEALRVFDINLRQSYFSRGLVDDMLSISDVLKLNDEELPVVADLLGLRSAGPAVIPHLFRAYPLKVIALTRGGGGSVLYSAAGASEHPGFPAEVVDTVGAGDAFTAALVLGLLKGHPPDEINAAANRLAAYVCSQPGATPPIPVGLLDGIGIGQMS